MDGVVEDLEKEKKDFEKNYQIFFFQLVLISLNTFKNATPYYLTINRRSNLKFFSTKLACYFCSRNVRQF